MLHPICGDDINAGEGQGQDVEREASAPKTKSSHGCLLESLKTWCKVGSRRPEIRVAGPVGSIVGCVCRILFLGEDVRHDSSLDAHNLGNSVQVLGRLFQIVVIGIAFVYLDTALFLRVA